MDRTLVCISSSPSPVGTGTARPRGAKWFGTWIRARRTALRLDRRRAVLASRGLPRALTVTLLVDLEVGDRLPTFPVVEALSAALRVPAWMLAERVRLAPIVEPPLDGPVDQRNPAEALAAARRTLRRGDYRGTAALADLIVHRLSDAAEQQAAQLTLAPALVELGFTALAASIAMNVCENAALPELRHEALVALTEAALAERRTGLATMWVAQVDPQELASGAPELALRYRLARAEVDLARGARRRAMAALIDLVGAQHDADTCWIADRAAAALCSAFRALGLHREAERWQRATERGVTRADRSVGAAGTRPNVDPPVGVDEVSADAPPETSAARDDRRIRARRDVQRGPERPDTPARP